MHSPFRTTVVVLSLVVCAASGGCSESATDGSGSPNPLPVILSIEPDGLPVGAASATVTVTGEGFVSRSRARIEGKDLATVFHSSSRLEIPLRAQDLAEGAVWELAIFNPPPGGGLSGLGVIEVGYTRPVIHRVEPPGAPVGSPALEVTISGSGLYETPVTQARLGPHPELGPTLLPIVGSVLNDSTFRFTLPSGLTRQRLALPIMLSNPGPAGGLSNPFVFEVGPPPPVLDAVTPTSVTRGVGARITAAGSQFDDSSRIVWNGVEYRSTVVSPTVLWADVPAEAVGGTTPVSVAVRTRSPGGGLSGTRVVSLRAPAPRISLLDPPSAIAGSPGIEVTVEGGPFTPQSRVEWDGVPRATTFVNATRLRVTVSGSDLVAPGARVVMVRDPGAGALAPAVGFPVLPGGFAVTGTVTVALVSADIVGDPARNRVYASIPKDAPTHANSVVALDPSDGSVVWSASAGSDPSLLSISDDGSYLYAVLLDAPRVARFDLATGTRDLFIDLPDVGEPIRAEDIVVIPGAPTTIAVSLYRLFTSPRHGGIAVFDGPQVRPLLSDPRFSESPLIEPSFDPEKIYGFNRGGGLTGFQHVLIRPDGAMEVRDFRRALHGPGQADIIFDSGYMFTTRGEMFDPETTIEYGRFGATGTILPDVANGRVHFFEGSTLRSFHPLTFQEIGSLEVPAAVDLEPLARFGDDGIVFGGGDAVVFLRSNLIGS